MESTNFSEWFALVTKKRPFPYQEKFATAPELPILLYVPTGAGKTATAVLSWVWRRRYADEAIRKQTPRRLVYCLPMRTLVEQTYAEVEGWLQKAKLFQSLIGIHTVQPPSPNIQYHIQRPDVYSTQMKTAITGEVELHLLMGGAVSNRWDAYPEKDSILIGTQDQLLSRALNRGYSMSRYRWPIHFALLNNDCLWVMDEVQLMGTGLKTTAQLQGFREKFETYGPARSLWMSATLDSTLLETVDYQPDRNNVHQLTDKDLEHPILQQRMQSYKRLLQTQTTFDGKEDIYAKALAAEVTRAHTPGTLTLAICNRVSRAQEVYKALQKIANQELLPLIHSRFRGAEREKRKELLRSLRSGERSGILVATQAIEAGVDLSTKLLFTELAPWSSLVQRVGRCNRYGEYSNEATVYWIDIPDLEKKGAASPYEAKELSEARLRLSLLNDVGPESLKQVKAPSQKVEGLIPRSSDLLQLFDTSTDLAGHDIDISAFIRETEDNDVAIAWRNWEGSHPPNHMSAVQQNELCRVSLSRAKDFLDKLKKQKRSAWVWDGLRGEWIEAKAIYPGVSLLLHCSNGGYSEELGFTGDSNDKPSDVQENPIEPDRDDADPLTYQVGQYITLVDHSQDVAEEVRQLCEQLSGYNLPTDCLARAGRWHDLGKAHPVFQKMIAKGQDIKGGPWAKSAAISSVKAIEVRRGFRHELVSALVALQVGEPFLLAYLSACHHGKVRMTIQPRPTEKPPTGVERYALGVWEGDCFPAIDLGSGVKVEAQKLSLACMELGSGEHGESWTAQAIALLEEYGPFKLAFLETIIRLADWRGSAKRASKVLEQTDA